LAVVLWEPGKIVASKWKHYPRDTRGNFSVCLECIFSILCLIWNFLYGFWVPMLLLMAKAIFC